jgi:hypothetical protein
MLSSPLYCLDRIIDPAQQNHTDLNLLHQLVMLLIFYTQSIIPILPLFILTPLHLLLMPLIVLPITALLFLLFLLLPVIVSWRSLYYRCAYSTLRHTY